MGKVFDGIDEQLERWIASQPLFFVGSAPLAPDGHVNVSPKGPIDTLRVLDPHTVAYLDVVGSGAETIAHLRENGRIVVMFCAFQGPPQSSGCMAAARCRGFGSRVRGAVGALPVRGARAAQARRSIVRVEVDRRGFVWLRRSADGLRGLDRIRSVGGEERRGGR